MQTIVFQYCHRVMTKQPCKVKRAATPAARFTNITITPDVAAVQADSQRTVAESETFSASIHWLDQD